MVVIKKSITIFFLSLLVSVCSAAAQVVELPNEAVSKKVLENGFTVLAKPSVPDGLVSVDVRILAGSGLEDEYLGSGISHLVEHMVFKGTKTRPVGAIEKEVKSYGGLMTGSANQDMTNFNIVLPSEYLPQAMAILKDMLTNASFESEEFVKEKEVILKEIKLNKDEPQSRLMKMLNENAYLRHAYRYPVIGYEDAFKALTRSDAVRFYSRMYVPNRMVVTIVGGVDPSDAISKAELEFKDLRKPNYGVTDSGPDEPVQISARRAQAEADINLAYLALGFHSTSLLSEDLFAMDVLAMILGRGNNSRLNTLLFKNKSVVHNVSCWNHTPKDPGLFVITAILDKENLSVAEKSAMEEIERLRTTNAGDDELEGARRMALGDFISSLQTLDGQADDISTSFLLTGACDFSRRYIDGIQKVSSQDIRRVANKYLRADNLTVVGLVPAGHRSQAPRPESAAGQDTIQKDVLANGLRILVRQDAKVPTVSITLAMLGGLMAENRDNNGISNFTANMLLKGTSLRKESQIAGFVEALGGGMNAFSGFNSFGLNLEVLKPDMDQALDILKDVISDSVFPQDEIESLKTLTVAMIKEGQDDIFEVGLNRVRKGVFGASPYGFRNMGEEGVINSLKRKDILSFYKRYCVPNNMVISVSGDVEAGILRRKIKEKFSDLKSGDPKVPVLAVEGLDRVLTQDFEMDKEEGLVLIGFRTTSITDHDRYAFDILGSVLSGYSGRLFTELRNKVPMAYALGCVQKLALDTGFFAFYVATAKEDLEAVRKALTEEIGKIRQSGITDEELVLAKRELTSARAVAAQTNSFYALSSAIDELYGLGYDNLYRYDAEIEKVTSEDVNRIADKYFDPKAYAEVVISPK